jgi:two-component sensor histidine kinase
VLFFLLLRPSAWGQSLPVEELPVKAWYEQLEEVKVLLASTRNDEALQMLLEMEQAVQEADMTEAPISLWVQLYIGDALEKDHRDEEAVLRLLQVKELSQEKALPAINAEASIILGLLYEKLGMPEESRANLREAEQEIETHAFDSIYPEYAVRIASYHRIYGDQDSARYFARRALETATALGLEEQAGVGHILLGLLNRGDCEKALFYFKKGAASYYRLGDYTGYATALANCTRSSIECGMLEEALAYSDSSLVAIQLAKENGNDYYTWDFAYQLRAAVFHRLGQHDSAWVNINKGMELAIEWERRESAEAVREIDARYQDEQKARKLAEQEQVIAFGRQRALLLWVVIFLTLIILAILANSYLQLRSANQKVTQQSAVIRKNNQELIQSLEEQIILRNEVHHRVKNNLQVIINLLEIQEDDLQDPAAKKGLKAMANRIQSMATVHEILYQGDEVSHIDFLDYTQRICRHLSALLPQGQYPEFDIQMEPVSFNLETSIPLGIMLNELLTNSIKYARIPGKPLRILISLQQQGKGYDFHFRDNGPGLPEATLHDQSSGLGTYLIRSMTRQLKGKLECSNEQGAVYRIYFEEKNPTTPITEKIVEPTTP